MNSLNKKMDHKENRISGPEEKVEELDVHSKKIVIFFQFDKWNTQEHWDTVKITNVQIMGIQGEFQIKERTKLRVCPPCSKS